MVNGLVSLHGSSELDSRVKADSNCLLQMFALSRVSVFKIPFSQSDVISNMSFSRTSQMTKTFSPAHFFLGQSESGLSGVSQDAFPNDVWLCRVDDNMNFSLFIIDRPTIHYQDSQLVVKDRFVGLWLSF